jgi:hypothetical protein
VKKGVKKRGKNYPYNFGLDIAIPAKSAWTLGRRGIFRVSMERGKRIRRNYF